MPFLFFGGSFNPIHHGHLICARAVAEQRGYERVVLIPTAEPPHKPGSHDMARAPDRLKMCQLATADSPLFEVDDTEMRRGGVSYTLDTVRALSARGSGTIRWLIGADMLLFLPQWHQALQLVKEVEFVVIARPGWTIDWSALPEQFRALRSNVVEAPLIDIGASQLRSRARQQLPIDFLTPESVCRYIHAERIYR